jgi:hypothetical protein
VGDAAQAGMAQAQADAEAAHAALGVDDTAGPTLADDAAVILAEERARAARARKDWP